MKTMSLIFTVLIILCLVVFGLSCKKDVAESEKSAEEVTDIETTESVEEKSEEETLEENKQIVVGSEAGTGWTEHLKALSEEWTKTTGIDVVFAEIPYSDMANKFLIELVSGSGAYDVIMANRDGYTIPFAAAGYLEPLDDLLTDEEWNDFFPTAKKAAMWDGHIYAIPQNMCVEVFYYRTDLLEKYNIDVPKNWDDMLEAAKKLTIDEDNDGEIDIYGLGLKGKRYIISAFWLLDFMHQNGARVFDDNGKVVVNSPEAIEALTFMSDLLNTYGVVSQGSLNADENVLHTAFMEGSIAMLQNWNYMYSLANNPDESKVAGNLEAVKVPGNVNGGAVCGGWQCTVSASSKNKDAAKDWVAFVTTPEADIIYALEYETQPAHLSTFENEELKSKYGSWLGTLKEALDESFTVPLHPKWLEIAEVLQDAIQNTLTEKNSAEESLNEAAQEIEEIIK